MPLENATTFAQLDENWPLGLDSASRGDDHLRLIKAVLKAQFPGAAGDGFAVPITISEADLNGLMDKVNGIANLFFPVGTVVIRLDNINPSTMYGGTWALISGNASLALGDGTAQSGSVTGSNTVGVPLPQHNHVADHNLSTAIAGGHVHGGVPARTRVEVGGSTGTLYSVYADGQTYDGGEHGHTIQGGIGIENSGTPGATIDVTGAVVKVNVWKRTAL